MRSKKGLRFPTSRKLPLYSTVKGIEVQTVDTLGTVVKWSHAIAWGWATLLLDRLRNFVVVPSFTCGSSSFEKHSMSTKH